ncbi:uncharacterized protein LOC107412426 isoform X1 [Ziziphus jujuba]|uniref:Uncharacterized protein LOC107412426 isoform X1 n=1 Tax=Ziziphus jujuba TaxID=326968 RepID=A0A6P3ZDE0_ZIZJJ|nr:uncharacterized protein LOC107412426 isoform X1 [Ziziphus jujuba]
MEDPNDEWEIQEYESKSYNRGGRVSWILNKGLGLGKKILVTGVLFSSAPLVLPPLVIVSAIGFAVSVPSGVFLASYACAQKLMSKLLPRPAPRLLEYGTASNDNEEEIYLEEGGDACLEESIDMQKEEEEEKDDRRGGIETRVELSEKENNEIEEWDARKEGEEDYHEEESVEMNEEENIERFEDLVKTVEKNNDENEDGKAMDRGDIGEKDVKRNEIEETGDVDHVKLVDKEKNEEGKGKEEKGYAQEGVRRNNAQDREEKVDVHVINVEENGYQEDDGEYLDLVDDHLEVTNGVQIEGDREEYKEETLPHERENEEPIKVHGVVLDLDEGDEEKEGATIEVTTVVMEENVDQARANDIEEEEIEKETTGLLERIRDEGNADDPAEKEKLDVQKPQGVEDNGDRRITAKVEDIEIPVEDKIVHSEVNTIVIEEKGDQARPNDSEEEEIEKEMTGLLERIRDEGKVDDPVEKEKHDVEKTQGVEGNGNQMITTKTEAMEIPAEDEIVDSDVGLGKCTGIIEEERAQRNIKEVAKEGQEMQDMEYKNDLNDVTGDVGMGEEQIPVVNSSSTLQEGKPEDNVDDANSSKKKIVALTNADAGEIGNKSGFDDQNVAKGKYSYAVNETSKDSMDHAASLRKDDSKDAGISSAKEVPMPSNEPQEVYNEEKIWEQIEAMRSIIGYKVTPQKTCMEELKALYVFTGVEPPASFKDPYDLIEVNSKLRFLMSIIGLK